MATGDCYTESKAALVAAVASSSDDLPVPATPGWNVIDLLRHLSGVACDVVSGDVALYAQPEWTDEQVASRSAMTRVEVLDEWDSVTASMVESLNDPEAAGLDDFLATAPLVDLVLHRQDLAAAADTDPTLLDSERAILWPRRVGILGAQIDGAGLSHVTLSTPTDSWTTGPDATVKVSADSTNCGTRFTGDAPEPPSLHLAGRARPQMPTTRSGRALR